MVRVTIIGLWFLSVNSFELFIIIIIFLSFGFSCQSMGVYE